MLHVFRASQSLLDPHKQQTPKRQLQTQILELHSTKIPTKKD